MNISKIKLINGGLSGIEITCIEPIRQKNMTILDHVKRNRPFPLPDPIRNKIQGLKYFFLNLTGHWIEPYNKNFDLQEYKIIFLKPEEEPTKSFLLLQSMMNNTVITGVTLKSGGFILEGKIETIEGKKINLVTPFVTEEDDVSFFTEAMDKIIDSFNDIANIMENPLAIQFNAKATLEATGVDTKDMGTMSAEEMVDLVMKRFADSGAIVLMNEGMETETKQLTEKAGEKPNNVILHQSTGNIDSDNVPDAQLHVEDDGEQGDHGNDDIKTTFVKPVSSTLASDAKFPNLDEPGKMVESSNNPVSDLQDMEYSDNMGIPVDGPALEDDVQQTTGEW